MSDQKEPPPTPPPPHQKDDPQKEQRERPTPDTAEIKRKAAARARELLLIEKSLPKE